MWCYRNVVSLTDRLLLADEHGYTYTPSGPFSFHIMLIKHEEPQYPSFLSFFFFFFFYSFYEYLYGNFWLNQ